VDKWFLRINFRKVTQKNPLEKLSREAKLSNKPAYPSRESTATINNVMAMTFFPSCRCGLLTITSNIGFVAFSLVLYGRKL